MEKILIVSENESQQIDHILRTDLGYEVFKVDNSEEALHCIASHQDKKPTLVLVDIEPAETKGLQLLRSITMCAPQLPVIFAVPYGDENLAMKAIDTGATDFLIKPFWVSQLRLSIAKAAQSQHMLNHIAYLERKSIGNVTFSDIVGNSEAIQEVVVQARKASMSSAPLWIAGEAGTEKELLAMAIHAGSLRASRPFIQVECSTLQGLFAEKTLFGTPLDGKDRDIVAGKLLEAGDGTIFLRNVDVLSESLQQRLQHAIKYQVIRSNDGTEIPFRARVILTGESHALNKATGRVCPADYRALCANVIAMPALRERKEDIPAIATHLVRTYAATENKCIKGITPDAIEFLMEYSWPGNMHEMSHLLWRVVMLSGQDMIHRGDIRLIKQLQPLQTEVSPHHHSLAGNMNSLLLDEDGKMRDLASIEKEVIQFALTYTGGCMTHAAKNLGIGRSTLYRRISVLDIE